VVLRLLNKSASRGESEKAVDSASPIFSQLPDSAHDNAVGTGERQGQLTMVSSIPFAVAEPVNQTLSYAACFRSAFLSGFELSITKRRYSSVSAAILVFEFRSGRAGGGHEK